MNSTHVTVGTASISAMAALTTLLTGWHGLDTDHAAAAAWLICMAVGAIYAGTVWFIRWRWPQVPPFSSNTSG